MYCRCRYRRILIATASPPKLQNGGGNLETTIQPIDLPLYMQLDNSKLLWMDLNKPKKVEN